MNFSDLFTQIITVLMGFFAIMNPIANTSVFLGLTARDSSSVRRRIAKKSLMLSFCIITAFTLGGQYIFTLFGITLTAFRLVGGILVALVGYHMLQGGEHSPIQNPSSEDQAKSIAAQLEVSISPLAMPILAGPGTIATAMNFTSSGKPADLLVTLISFGLLCVITYIFFIYGNKFIHYIGDNGIKVVTRLMGLILAVIGMQMMIGGIVEVVSTINIGVH
ncbi:MAG: MarC family protein [Endozoicomonas sp. (ex Botrylloides leachii)]|nr:MarC family protein [Endozoicomonas sp. (ex Botrylloides leachii)]